jgi:hypothetical protein
MNDTLGMVAEKNARLRLEAIDRLKALAIRAGDAVGVGPVPTPSISIPHEFVGWDEHGDPLVREYGADTVYVADPRGCRGRVSPDHLAAYAKSFEQFGESRQVRELRAAAVRAR